MELASGKRRTRRGRRSTSSPCGSRCDPGRPREPPPPAPRRATALLLPRGHRAPRFCLVCAEDRRRGSDCPRRHDARRLAPLPRVAGGATGVLRGSRRRGERRGLVRGRRLHRPDDPALQGQAESAQEQAAAHVHDPRPLQENPQQITRALCHAHLLSVGPSSGRSPTPRRYPLPLSAVPGAATSSSRPPRSRRSRTGSA